MPHATTLIVLLVLFTAALVGVLVARPGITETRGGKILAFLALFFLPILCGAMGVSSEITFNGALLPRRAPIPPRLDGTQ